MLAAELDHPFEAVLIEAVRRIDLENAQAPEILSRLSGAAGTAGSARIPLVEVCAKLREEPIREPLALRLAAHLDVKAARSGARAAAQTLGTAVLDSEWPSIEDGTLDIESRCPQLGPACARLRIAMQRLRESDRAESRDALGANAGSNGTPLGYGLEVRRVASSSALAPWTWHETGWRAEVDRRFDEAGHDLLILHSLSAPPGCRADQGNASGAWLRLVHHALELGCDGIAVAAPFDARPTGKALLADGYLWDRPAALLIARSGRRELALFSEVENEDLPLFMPKNAAATLQASDGWAAYVKLPQTRRVQDRDATVLFGRMLPSQAEAVAEGADATVACVRVPFGHPIRRFVEGVRLTQEGVRSALDRVAFQDESLRDGARVLEQRLKDGVPADTLLSDPVLAPVGEALGSRLSRETLHGTALLFGDGLWRDWHFVCAGGGDRRIEASEAFEAACGTFAERAATRLGAAAEPPKDLDAKRLPRTMLDDLALVSLHAPARIAFDAARRLWPALCDLNLVSPFDRAVLRNAKDSFQRIASEEGLTDAEIAALTESGLEAVAFASLVAGVLAKDDKAAEDPERRPPVEALQVLNRLAAGAKASKHDLAALGLLGARDVFRTVSGSRVGRLSKPARETAALASETPVEKERKRQKEREKARRKAQEAFDALFQASGSMDPASPAMQRMLAELFEPLEPIERAALVADVMSGPKGTLWLATARALADDSNTVEALREFAPLAVPTIEDFLAEEGLGIEPRVRRMRLSL